MNPRGWVLIALIAGCGEDASRVKLEPVALPVADGLPCGKQIAKTALRVVAYTPAGELRRSVPPTDIDAFPEDTEQLGAEVIGSGGSLVAIGKTAPLAFDDLADGTSIPILMAPPDGFCPVYPMMSPRVAPAVARAGNGVLVVGGTDGSGKQLATAEWFDPSTAKFVPVAVPTNLVDETNGFAGVVLTELPDGTVALTGTSSHAYVVFDPATRAFVDTPTVFDHRAFHAAIAPDAKHLFLIGGCADVVGGACNGPNLRTGFTYDLADLAKRDLGPVLPDTASRIGAHMLDLGIQRDGVRRFLLAGDTGQADRFALADSATETLTGLPAQTALLDGGAVLAAFEPDGTTQTGGAGVLAPDGTALAPIAPAPKLDGARLVSLEDGSVLAIGGDPLGNVARYLPTTNTWSTIQPAGDLPGQLDAPITVRLADGNVLVLGGRTPSDHAWIYRPSLVGARTGSIFALPDGSTEGVLTAPDPATLSRTGGRFVLTATTDDLSARALVGGPRMATGSITAIARVIAGGVALIARQTGPGEMLVGRLVPGEPARIDRVLGGTTTTLCSGTQVDAGELTQQVALTISGDSATLTVGPAEASTTKVSCTVGAGERGAWGLAAAGTGAQVDVGPVTVARVR
ncbi:MAG: hypothetical protein HOV81_06300 [Kofleriaceae bacterium]|nr:hypothetical protein [Kofleriaceae bacterium]